MILAICNLRLATCYLLLATWYKLRATRTRLLLLVACCLLYATCYLLLASCYLLLATLLANTCQKIVTFRDYSASCNFFFWKLRFYSTKSGSGVAKSIFILTWSGPHGTIVAMRCPVRLLTGLVILWEALRAPTLPQHVSQGVSGPLNSIKHPKSEKKHDSELDRIFNSDLFRTLNF